jgi:hypothetical protein
MTITTAVWLLTLTFAGTDVPLVYDVPFDTSELCVAGGTRLGHLAIEISEGMYTFQLQCNEVITMRIAL